MKEFEVIDQPDGSAIVRADLTAEEAKAFAQIGMRWVLVLAAYNLTEEQAIDLLAEHSTVQSSVDEI